MTLYLWHMPALLGMHLVFDALDALAAARALKTDGRVPTPAG